MSRFEQDYNTLTFARGTSALTISFHRGVDGVYRVVISRDGRQVQCRQYRYRWLAESCYHGQHRHAVAGGWRLLAGRR